MFSKVLNSIENFSKLLLLHESPDFCSCLLFYLVFKNCWQKIHSGPSFSVNVKNDSHFGLLTYTGRGLRQHQCSGSAVPLGCRNREDNKGKAKIRRFAAVPAPWPSACCFSELPKFCCYASVISLCADASCMLLPGLICNLLVHAG